MSEQSERELAQAISGLQAAVGDLREAVGGLQEAVGGLQEATRANTAAIGRLTDRVGSLEGTMERVHVSLASKIDAGEIRDDPCLVKGRADCFLELIGDVEERVPSGVGRARSSAMVFRGTAVGSRMRASGRGGRTGPLARS